MAETVLTEEASVEMERSVENETEEESVADIASTEEASVEIPLLMVDEESIEE